MNPTEFAHSYSDFTIKWATLEWEEEQAQRLRREVFCIEQGLFDEHDRDEIDLHAICLVAVANHGGWHDKVVGTVRIHRHADNIWWGSRLAVDKAFRARSNIGATLIKLAVGSAHGLGCEQFLAQVQKQNEKLFQRLNWRSQFDLTVRNRPHVMMEADLTRYPPMLRPASGYVVKAPMPPVPDEIAPCLLGTLSNNASSVQHYA